MSKIDGLGDDSLTKLLEIMEYCRDQIESLKLDMRHIQNQTTDYNTRLVNLTLKVDKCINQRGYTYDA